MLKRLNGKSVRIKKDQILDRNAPSDKFRKFLEDRGGEVFTAVIERPYSLMYTLKEDRFKIKWLFFEEDLEEVGGEN